MVSDKNCKGIDGVFSAQSTDRVQGRSAQAEKLPQVFILVGKRTEGIQQA